MKTLTHHSVQYMGKNQPKLKDTITEMKNILKGNYTKLDDIEYMNNLEEKNSGHQPIKIVKKN